MKMNPLGRFLTSLTILGLTLLPIEVFAAGAITPSGGGSNHVGATFTVTVKASGATFDSLQGLITVSGPVSVVSFSAGGATWLPGKTPANNNQFVGIANPTSSLTVATIKLKGTSTGSGSVKVSGVRLARSGSEVGTGGGTTSFTITPAPTPPGSISVSSSSHPDQEQSYEDPTALVSWAAPANGANGYSVAFDQTADTTPAATVTTTETSAKYENLTVGTHYFHIRANNKDGWGATTHFKINIKPKTDSSLSTPAITSISTANDAANDIAAGTLSGLVFKGTGPVGYSMILTFQPDLALSAEKYPAPMVAEDGSWELTVTDPVKAGFYKLTVYGRKDAVVSPTSPETVFEVTVGDGGQVKLIDDSDTTAAYKQAQAAESARVAAAKARKKIVWGGAVAVALIAATSLFVFRRRLFRSGL